MRTIMSGLLVLLPALLYRLELFPPLYLSLEVLLLKLLLRLFYFLPHFRAGAADAADNQYQFTIKSVNSSGRRSYLQLHAAVSNRARFWAGASWPVLRGSKMAPKAGRANFDCIW
jgi:hypothetical protein